ncbi:MAG: hypothetical protein JWQ87_5579 [Candidatus Sulfotelmatobacter sp.]|nr:hypothetical protein [Candidatus Sulfotelmatobacter sp.]
MRRAIKFDMAKTVKWPGATPFYPCFAGQNPSGFSGSLPATLGLVVDSPDGFCHGICAGQSLTERFLFHTEDRDAFAQTT